MRHDGHSPGKSRKVWLMIWETNRSKMGGVQEIKVNSLVPIEEGDTIMAYSGKEYNTVYSVDRILEVRPSSMKDMTYYTIKSKRTRENFA